MMTILLYGHLGNRFGRVHHYEVATAAEAVRAMMVTLDGFRKALVDGGAYRVLLGGREALTSDRLTEPFSHRDTLRFVPVIAGAGNGAGQFILGAILVIAGSIYDWSGTVVNVGYSLMIGGAAQIIFATKVARHSDMDRPENRPSYSFNGPVNTAAQGNAVSILYGGPLLVGSQVVSAELSVEQIA